MPALFVTSTGTEVGKTFVIEQCLQSQSSLGPLSAIKPIISGWQANDLESDTARLLRASQLPIHAQSIEQMSPIRFHAPLSPDQAAKKEGKHLDFELLLQFCHDHLASSSRLLIEGVGGVCVPLTDRLTVLDWIKALNIPVLLVTGSYLGTLSHTLTAVSVLQSHKVQIASIIINQSECCTGIEATQESLTAHCPEIPMIAWTRHASKPPIEALTEIPFFQHK